MSSESVEPTSDDLREIERTASQISVQGDCYPEAFSKLTGR
ncbi:hypothetical protein ACLEPN_25815 [Myxococcus sp. 1LA]